MRFTISSNTLFTHLQAISKVINSRPTLQILENFLFTTKGTHLTINASDSENTMETYIELNECDEDGSFAISAKHILDALKEIPEQPVSISFNPGDLAISINYLNGQINLMGQSADEYPQTAEIPDDENTVNLSIPADVLQKGISKCLLAVGDDSLRRVLTGIYFDITPEDLTIVSTNGRKLVRNKYDQIKSEGKSAFILAKKPATLLKSVLANDEENIEIKFNSKNAVFKLAEYTLTCRLIESKYPNYNAVIPQNSPNIITVEKQLIIGALRRVSLFAASSDLIRFNIENNKIVLSSQDMDFSTSAEETVPCQYEGMNMHIGFQALPMLDILNNIDSESVTIELTDPSRAGVIKPAEQEKGCDLLMLLMPITINY
ncbi:MAG TPA: DNA polymerase III subunit beta [Candidatus Avibacteroides excrementipullorum]|jgi:DNA polymerase-3 subunit beta|nr:DNA polymerase III subunit beta [Candidatus Avibacteroides excrementipullorum]